MPYPNDNKLNIVISQTSGSADGSGKFPFTERIISGSNLFILTDANGNLTGSTSIPGGSFTNLTVTSLTASFITASTISASSNVYVSGSLTVIGNIAGTIDSASAVSVSSINTGSTYYVTFVDGTTGVRQLKTDADILSYIPSTNTLAVGTSASGSITVGSKVTMQDLGGTSQVRVGINTTDTASFSVSSTSFNVAKGFGPGIDKVFTNLELSASNNVLFSNTTQATDWTNGALNVAGGVGIGKNLYVSGSLNVLGTTLITASVLIPSASYLTFSGTGSSTYASSSTLGYFDSGNYGDFLIQSNNVPRVRIGGSTGNITFNNINGSNILILSTLTSSLYSSNVTINASGSVEMNGNLAVNGGDITTTAGTATLFNTNATSVNIGGGAITQVLLGSAIGTVKSAGDFIVGTNIIKDSSAVTALTLTSTLTTVAGDLQVNGNDIKDSGGTNNLTLSSTRVNVPLTTQATDWTTGALAVAGGVGIGKNLYVSGSTFLYGDLTIYGTGSVVNISSSTIIIGDNRIQLNAGTPVQRYAGIDVFDSGSGTFTNNVTSSLLWDGLNDNWLLVSNNQTTGNPLTQSSAIMIGGPSGSFGNESLLTVNYIPKAQATGKNLQNSGLIDNGTLLSYTGTGISASQITASNLTIAYTGSITYATGVYITYTTGSFTTLTITTGSSPGLGAQVPSSPTANGLAGQINVDNNFIYVYTNQVWKRVPLSTWTA